MSGTLLKKPNLCLFNSKCFTLQKSPMNYPMTLCCGESPIHFLLPSNPLMIWRPLPPTPSSIGALIPPTMSVPAPIRWQLCLQYSCCVFFLDEGTHEPEDRGPSFHRPSFFFHLHSFPSFLSPYPCLAANSISLLGGNVGASRERRLWLTTYHKPGTDSQLDRVPQMGATLH
jgi:hypothetical protein